MADTERYRREAEFHDRAFEEHSRSQLQRFYSITGASRGYYRQLITRGCASKSILEYGCGPGSYGVHLAALGAHVTGIDISPVAIALAKESSVHRGLDVDWLVMNAEALDLPDASFDMVCGSAILHHLDLSRALPEVKRVLKPSGRAVFYEALGHNPIINWYRRRTPHLRSRDEHPLREHDFRLIERHFDSVTVRTFHLTTLAAVPLRNSRAFPKVVSALDAFDRGLFRALPMLRKHAWSCVIEASLSRMPTPSEAH
jgi:SAM-dependent methyltransferase